MKEIKIDTSKWRTGDGSPNRTGIGTTKLLNDEGYMCCLGFTCEQLGIPKEKLLNVGTPKYFEVYPFSYSNRNTQLSIDAVEINDSMTSTVEEKKQQLTELFAKHDLNLQPYELK